MRSHATLICWALLAACASVAGPGKVPRTYEVQHEGFESMEPGELTGNWSAKSGHAEIHAQHRHAGQQSLRLMGGERRQVVWRPDLPVRWEGVLSFWAERWTRREPFSASIERLDEGRWTKLWSGDEQIAVGGFDTQIRVPLARPAPEALRWTCTSPEDTGLLIDSLMLQPAGPGRVVRSSTLQPVLPCLVESRVNPLCAFTIEVEGTHDMPVVQELVFDLSGTTDLGDLRELQVYGSAGPLKFDYRNPEQVFREAQPFGVPSAPAARLVFQGGQLLHPGENQFWLSASFDGRADLDHRVRARPVSVRLGGGQALEPDASPAPLLRLGHGLRRGGDDGSAAHRIPGLATTQAGSLIAVYDLRWGGWGDLPGHVDVGLSRSTDGGRSWEPMRVIMDMGDDPEFDFDGIGDPAVLVDRQTGRIWVVATWSHGNRAWRGSGPGLSPEETGQLMMVSSDDDGLTWSEPRNLTAEVKDPDWCYVLQGPGRGISLEDGSLVFAAQYQDAERLPHATLLVSHDHGETWRIPPGPQGDTTEAQVVELDGRLMLNMRDNRGGSRSVYETTDFGETWSEHASSRGALVEPVCMASLLHVERELGLDRDGLLLFSNPAVDAAPRRRMTIKASRDQGASWPEPLQVLLDEGSSAGYSCLTMIDADTVGILFEGSRAQLTFLRVPLADLLGESLGER